jgi:predicted amidohydrolase
MVQFKIAAAQIPSIRDNLDGNLEQHLEAIAAAARRDVSVLVFPELSLMGYEPELAKAFEMSAADPRLQPIAELAQRHQMQVVAGAAIANNLAKPYLGAFVFDENGAVRTYAKMHLGGNESEFFNSGSSLMSIESHGQSIGLSICADSSRRSHPAAYSSMGMSVYAASVFLNAEWYAADSPRFARHAAEFHMLVLMANHAASIGTLCSVGKSAVWAPDGSLIACATGTETALVIATRTLETWMGEVVSV